MSFVITIKGITQFDQNENIESRQHYYDNYNNLDYLPQ